MIKNILGIVLVCALGLAVWRLWGVNGNIGELLNSIWSVFYTVIDAVANAIITAVKTVFP